MSSLLSTYFQPRVFLMLFLGFSSGLPLALTASTLTAWLSEAGVTKTSIGLFASVATPYALKFLWAPLMDGTRFPILGMLGRRRGWLLATQLMLVAAIIGLGLADPAVNAWHTAFFALLVAIASASQDIVIDAYRVEVLPKEQFGPGVAMVTLGYRIGMLVSGAGALYLASSVSWQMTYFVMSSLMLVGIIAVLLSPEPETSEQVKTDAPSLMEWIEQSVIAPFKDFAARDGWIMLLLFIVLFKLGDAFLGIMTNPFLLEIGFEKTQIATIVKVYGFAATILGTFLGASLAQRYGTYKPLWISGALHALTNLMFLWQAHVGADPVILALGISLENFTGGVSGAVFVVFISGLCRVQYTATQYALLSSLAALGRTTLSSSAGFCAEYFGWEIFFVICVAMAFPSLFLLRWIQKRSGGI